MEDRLPSPKDASRERPLTPDGLGRLDRLEAEIGGGGIRNHRLERLHEDAVALFVRSFGFGVERMSPYPSESNLSYTLRSGTAPPQPGPRLTPAQSPGEWLPLRSDEGSHLDWLHEESVIDFSHPSGFGYFKDRRHVAGFQSHRFGQVPQAQEHWHVLTLDLVSLLLHDEPVVYVSSHLPRMDEHRDGPTRPLDPFESGGLNAIEGGDDLSIGLDGDIIRMLGAIRGTKQCIACHGGERGDLLGAFSYTLRREESNRSRLRIARGRIDGIPAGPFPEVLAGATDFP